MEATAVSLARSVLDGVLSSAGSAFADEVARLLGVPKEVEFIRNELEMMQAFLRVASARPDTVGRYDTVRTWVKQVRDLACDFEDCLLEFSLYADTSSSSSWAGSWLPGPLAARHRIAAWIRELKASLEELNQRNLRYHIVVDHYIPARTAEDQPPAALPVDYEAHSAELAFRESDIIGRNRDKRELARLISGGGGGALAVVSVWGMGGMGKSSLVKMVHNDPVLLDQFDCGAWVTVPHPFDSADEFWRQLSRQLGLPHSQQLVQKHLQGKRFRIVVDDVLSQEEWEHVWMQIRTFDNSKGSRVIVTTRREDVARFCAGSARDVYELKPLEEQDSKKLFLEKVYKTTEYTFPKEMEEQADHILKRCRGLPLAISTIGGLLASRPKTSIEWVKLHEHLGAELESDLRNITKVIVSSYDGLPYHLKSIFLYLSIFPENHEIRCARLLRRWIAEGYIAKNRDMPVEEVGERLYSELINRSMIQPTKNKISPGVRVNRCRVHGMVLQIILSKFTEENQLFLMKKHGDEVPQSKIRHLVVSRWKREKILQNINLSCVRSLTVFGEFPASLISPKMQLLRVLDLEDAEGLKNEDLMHIGELHHLRYLCLRGTEVSRLPRSLKNLQYLETLDIQDTHVTQLPDGIAKLEKLRYLLAGVSFSRDLLQKVARWEIDIHKANLLKNKFMRLLSNNSDHFKKINLDQFSVRAPEGIEKLRNLHMLSVVNVGESNGFISRIKDLTNLRRLGVAGLTKEEGLDLCKSIEKLSRLQRLEVRSDSLEFLAKINESAAPKHLVSLRLYGKLSKIPPWISSLIDLAKVKLLGTQLKQGEVALLGNLRSLALLALWENSYAGDSLCFCADTFPKLKLLDIDGLENIERVKVMVGAMPELEQFWVNNCKALQDNDEGLSGVPHLPNLNELLLKNCGEKEKLMRTLRIQVSQHDKRPKFLVGKLIAHTSPTNSEGGMVDEGTMVRKETRLSPKPSMECGIQLGTASKRQHPQVSYVRIREDSKGETSSPIEMSGAQPPNKKRKQEPMSYVQEACQIA